MYRRLPTFLAAFSFKTRRTQTSISLHGKSRLTGSAITAVDLITGTLNEKVFLVDQVDIIEKIRAQIKLVTRKWQLKKSQKQIKSCCKRRRTTRRTQARTCKHEHKHELEHEHKHRHENEHEQEHEREHEQERTQTRTKTETTRTKEQDEFQKKNGRT